MDFENVSKLWYYLFGYGDGQVYYDILGNLFMALITTVVVIVPVLVLRKIIDLIVG